jgi:spermidine synthase
MEPMLPALRHPPLPPWRVGLILLGSGTAALVYQMAWTRELRLIFGASTAATAAVLAVFIGGLGAGGMLFGKRADRAARPLALYAKLELGAAGLAALSPLLLWAVRAAYVALGGSTRLGAFGGSVLRLLLGALVLAPPTLMMGGAMPAAVAAVEADEDQGRRRLALLYGLNTLGAVMGCLLATFVLLEALGTRWTLWSASGLGACVALVALLWTRKRTAAQSAGGNAHELAQQGEPTSGPGDVSHTAAPTGFVLAAAGVVGFAFFLMELVWYRMLGPLLGGTVFAFGIILGVALLGIGLGSASYGALEGRARRPATLTGFSVICLIEAAAIALPYAAGDRIAMLALFLRPLGGAYGFAGHVGVWAILAGVVVLPAAVASGVQFPLLIGLLGRGRAEVGRQTGLAYAANTVGAIAGSLAGGFGLLPVLTAPGCWRLVSAILLITALLSLALARRRAPAAWPGAVGLLLASVLVTFLLQSPGPTAVWRHSPIAVGRVDPAQVASPNSRRDWESSTRRSIARDDEGLESSVALDRSSGYAFILNGKTDGHARVDAGTQVMGGLFGAFVHPGPHKAFVIGLGTGSTSGWLAAIPSIERVDTVELEPAIAQIARDCGQVNHDVMTNPKHHLIAGDAREVLLTSDVNYDIIASEPSNPYRAGIASLFTREYYESAMHRLAPGGIFLQWVQAYAIDARTFRIILATLAGVFPQVEIWLMAPSDLLLVATREPIRYDAPVLRERMKEEPFHSAFAGAWSTVSLEGVLAHHVARAPLARKIATVEGATINTDDRTLVEFGFARSLTAEGTIHVADVMALARAQGLDRIELAHDDVDRNAVVEEREAYGMSLGMSAVAPPDAAADLRERLTALNLWTAGDYAGALAHWRAQPEEPHNPVEAMVVADSLAATANQTALVLAEQLRAIWPSVADGIAGGLYLRRGEAARASEAFEASLISYRSQPWPPPTFMLRALGLATEATRGNPALLHRLFDVLSVPFAVHMMDESRALTRIGLAHLLPPGPACLEALEYFEPHVPWQAEFLAFRAACYERTGDARAATALHDLERFRAQIPTALGAGL